MGSKSLTRRDFLRLSALTAAGAALAGCGPKPTATTAPPVEPTVAPTAPPAEPITLTQVYHSYGEAGVEEAVYRYADQYHEFNPNVTVEVTWSPDINNAMNTSMAAGTGPDVYETNPGPSVEQVAQNWAAPLDDVVSADEKADFNQVRLARNTINGRLYAIPMCIDTGAVTYRKSMAEAAGVAEPAVLADLVANMEALNTGRVKGLFLGNDSGVDGFYAEHLVFSTGTTLLTDDFKPAFATEGVAAAMVKFREISTSDALLVGAPQDWWMPDSFTGGLCAMQEMGLWAFPAITTAIADDWDLFIWPPAASGGKSTTFLGGWVEVVNPSSAHVAEAAALARWLWIDNAEIQEDFNLSYGFHIPPRLSVAAKATKLQAGQAAKMVSLAQQGFWNEPAEWIGAMGTALNDAFVAIVTQGADPMPALQTAADKVQQELDALLG